MNETLLLIEAEWPWFLPLMVFLLGACIGSFLNVCIYRIPAARSVIFPGSHCGCGAPIAWYDNIPIVTWLLRRGRARCCGRRFSVRYPLVEAGTAGLFLAAWLVLPPLVALCAWVLIGLLVVAALIDLDHTYIPDRCSIGGVLIGVTLAMAVPALHGHVDPQMPFFVLSFRSGVTAVIGVLVGSAVILWIGILAEVVLRREAMGFGDVKLLGCLGAFLGWEGALFSIFGGAVVGSVLVLTLRIFGVNLGAAAPEAEAEAEAVPVEAAAPAGEAADTATEPEPAAAAVAEDAGEEPLSGREIPFGPMLVAGGLLYLLVLSGPVDAWFGEISWMLRSR